MEVHVSLKPETLFHLGPLPVTNSMLQMFLVMGVLLLVGSLIARRASLIPGRIQGAFELIVEFLLDLVESSAGKKAGRRIFPLVGALFIFIAFANYSGVLPGVGTIGTYHTVEGPAHDEGQEEGGEEVEIHDASSVPAVREVASVGAVPAGVPALAEPGEKTLVPFLRAPNADLNMTLALAILTFVIVQIAGIAAHGVGGRIKHMADPPFLFPIELISEFSRIISLSARLFGNVFAGEILLGVMVSMVAAIRIAVIPLLVPVVFIGLELLFGTIQALVFSLLTVIYITLATSGGHEAHDEAQHTAGAHGIGNVPASAGD